MAKRSESKLAAWLDRQPRGAMRRLSLKTGLAPGTIDRAKRGLRVQRETAELLSAGTGGEVAVAAIAHVKRGESARAGTNPASLVA